MKTLIEMWNRAIAWLDERALQDQKWRDEAEARRFIYDI